MAVSFLIRKNAMGEKKPLKRFIFDFLLFGCIIVCKNILMQK